MSSPSATIAAGQGARPQISFVFFKPSSHKLERQLLNRTTVDVDEVGMLLSDYPERYTGQHFGGRLWQTRPISTLLCLEDCCRAVGWRSHP